MAEWRVSDVMYQRECFNQINIQSKLRGNGARNLRHFNGVSETVAEMVGVAAGKYLGLRFQAAKRPGVNYPVAVALKIVAIAVRRLRVAPSSRMRNGVGSKSHQPLAVSKIVFINRNISRAPEAILTQKVGQECPTHTTFAEC